MSAGLDPISLSISSPYCLGSAGNPFNPLGASLLPLRWPATCFQFALVQTGMSPWDPRSLVRGGWFQTVARAIANDGGCSGRP